MSRAAWTKTRRYGDADDRWTHDFNPPGRTPPSVSDGAEVPAADVPAAVRSYLLDEHAPLLGRVVACADAVAAGWDGDATADRERVVPPLAATFDRAGVTEALPAALADAVAATGRSLRAEPVPAPPYVVVTSTGPVLRATLLDGRLVVSLRVFVVERGPDGPRYRRSESAPGAVVDVAFE